MEDKDAEAIRRIALVSIPPYRLGLFPHAAAYINLGNVYCYCLNPTLQIRSIPTAAL